MTDPASVEDMAAYDMSGVKVATFCAEPVSPAVQQFAMDRICERYINSYWATEHGGMVFSCPWGDLKDLAGRRQDLAPAVDSGRGAHRRGSPTRRVAPRAWREADVGEKGELVITPALPLPGAHDLGRCGQRSAR
jgi:acrylyl-CoA reductase (NADPH)/3-hydroxypropionyl-CoA dehydratase/3-hydroxypropionyl-CoA synthetase